MDSRIREIEQWIAEAKSDLGECGREAYLRKLFLLDAEIRAVLKDNPGILPETVSPRLQEKRVRRLPTPRLALAGVAGMLLLAASTVYLSYPALFAGAPATSVPGGASPVVLSSTALSDVTHVPTLPEGEVLIADGWTPPLNTAAEPLPSVILADAGSAVADGALPGVPVGPLLTAPAPAMPVRGASPAASRSGFNQATSVMLASLPASGGTRRPVPSGGSGGGLSFGGDGAMIAREVRYTSEEQFRTPFDVNHTKDKTDQAAKASKDGTLPAEISVEQPVDEVDNQQSTDSGAVDKLDPEALKEALEKPFSR